MLVLRGGRSQKNDGIRVEILDTLILIIVLKDVGPVDWHSSQGVEGKMKCMAKR